MTVQIKLCEQLHDRATGLIEISIVLDLIVKADHHCLENKFTFTEYMQRSKRKPEYLQN